MSYSFEYTARFQKSSASLSPAIRQKLKKQLHLLAHDLRHASLKARKMKGTTNTWEARVDYHYRLTFSLQGNRLILKDVGTHRIYRQK
jgi:mRNA-degrading endonuclease RelE of RelBE toxin-antitoxin system